MSISLYHMTEQYRQAMAELTDANLPEEVVADTLEALEGELLQKGQAVAAFALNLGAEVEAIKAAEKAGYDVLIIDSYSHEWTGPGGCLEINDLYAKTNCKGNTWAAWNETTPRHRTTTASTTTSLSLPFTTWSVPNAGPAHGKHDDCLHL